MPARNLVLAGLGLLSLAGLALLFADTSALRAEDFKAGCQDWWCAPRNRLPIGFAILFGGLGITAVGVGLTRTEAPGDDDPPPPSPAAPRRPRPARRDRGYH